MGIRFFIVTEEELILGICDMHKEEFWKKNSLSILIIVSALYLALTFEGGILIHAEAMIDTYSKKCFFENADFSFLEETTSS